MTPNRSSPNWKRPNLSELYRHSLVQSALSLYGVQFAGYVFPLVTIPYLARVLGATGWGLVAFAQAFGMWVALLGEFGFSLSATREVARYRGDREKLTEILAGVLGAKALLAAVAVGAAALARLWIPIFRENPTLLWAGMFWALAQAFSMIWFFQGFERMRLVAALDIAAKALATTAIFVLVRKPDDGWLVLIAQGSGFFLSFAFGLGFAYRRLPFRVPTLHSVCEALRMGWSMFLYRSSVSLYTTGNAFILGLFVSPQLVGDYSGAEKISKAFLGLFGPISQTLYPRLSHLAHHDRDRAARLARIGVIVMGAGGAALGVLVFTLAPLLVRVILGHGFVPAVAVLRVLSLLAPLVAVNIALGILWMLPLGLDHAFNTITLVAGLLNVGLAMALASLYAGLGMAWAVVGAEIFVASSLYFVLRRRRLDRVNYSATARVDIARAGL